MERCEICDAITFLTDDICEDCERVFILDLTIDITFELRAIGAE